MGLGSGSFYDCPLDVCVIACAVNSSLCNLGRGISPFRLWYIVYERGTTGKGVMQEDNYWEKMGKIQTT